jgi:ABC-type phosphate transport system auxiliary subunit
MTGPGEVFLALIIIGLPVIIIGLLMGRWLRLKEKKIELEAGLAVEKAAQYAASNAELEARIRILEKIVTDGGYHTAAQIEALRDEPARLEGDKVQ